MKRIILLLIFALSISSVTAQKKDKRLKGIDKELNSILEATKAPGFAVAIVEGDKVIYAKGFGYRDYEKKVPVDANTLFAIGSSTKAFTSAVLGKLRADKKLSFNDNPRKYVPELEFYNDDMNNNIIIKDLMRHSTGLPRHDFSWYLFQSHNKDSLLARVKHQEPFTGIRQRWYYNNFMFLAQGVIAEKITDKSWEDNISEHFFKPLGMNRSNSTIAEMKSASNKAFGYQLKEDGTISKMDYYDIAGMSPAGSINSSVSDMTKWLITWINKGKYNDKEIIPESYIKEAMSSQMIISGALPSQKLPDMHFANYGYGWMLSSYRGHYRVEHGGNIDGFSASVAFFPTDKLGIVVLTNQNASAFTAIARNTIADRMLKGNKTNWIKRHVDAQEKAKKAKEKTNDKKVSSNVKNTKPSHIKADYTGDYFNPGYGKFQIYTKNDSLFLHATDKNKLLYLKHYHYDVFQLFGVEDGKVDTSGDGLKIRFTTNVSGDISEALLKVEPTLDAIAFKHTPKTIAVDANALKQYVGEYELAGTTIKVFTKEDTLYLFVPGQPEYELMATGEHKFSFKALEGFKVEFKTVENGVFKELVAIQPNGTFTATRK